MVWAARRAGLAFILNVVLNAEKKIIFAVAGDMEKAHARGCDFLSRICRVSGKASDIVITTNGGYPLDQNVYQSPKGMTAAATVVHALALTDNWSCRRREEGRYMCVKSVLKQYTD